MRNIINISLPKNLTKEVERQVREGGYATKSEFFRELVRRSLEEEKLFREIEESRKELRAGKGKILRSLRDLR